jgi:hypothetical protein
MVYFYYVSYPHLVQYVPRPHYLQTRLSVVADEVSGIQVKLEHDVRPRGRVMVHWNKHTDIIMALTHNTNTRTSSWLSLTNK